MPRKRMIDMMMARGKYPNRMMGMRNRGMYDGKHYGVRGGEHYPMDGNYPNSQYNDERNRRDYESGGQYDMGRMDYGDMRGRRRNARGQYMADRGYGSEMDGHYPMGQGSTYYPIEAMGTFNGYWGVPEEDYGRYDMRGRGRDYGYDMRYDMAGDYGESLTREELEHWCKKMTSELNEREKQLFAKETILQKAKNMGIQFDDFNEMEYYVNVVKNYTDHKKSIGENVDMAMKLARDDFYDEDGEYKGSEWLAVYYDTFVKEY